MTMHTPFWTRYQALRDRLHGARDEIMAAGFDLDAMARTLPSGNYPERDLEAIIKEIDALAYQARTTLESAKAKHANGIEADARIDVMIGGVH